MNQKESPNNGQETRKQEPNKKETAFSFLSIPWHVLVFVVYPTCFMISMNGMPFLQFAPPALLRIGIAAACLMALLSLVLRSLSKAALLVSALSLGFLIVGSTLVPEEMLGENDFILVLHYCSPFIVFYWTTVFIVIAGTLALLAINDKIIGGLTNLLNIFAVFLFFSTVYGIIQSEIAINAENLEKKQMVEEMKQKRMTDEANRNNRRSAEGAPEQQQDGKTAEYPDIYFILPDAFIGQLEWAGDPSAIGDLVEFLEERQFNIPKFSASNYTKTIFSVPSTMNMDYVHELLDCVLSDKPNEKNLYRAKAKEVKSIWANSLAVKHLKDKGYKCIYLPFGSPTFIDGYFDPEIGFDEVIDLRESRYQKHPEIGEAIEKKFGTTKGYFVHGAFEALKQLSSEPQLPQDGKNQPRFIFSHIMSPHGPWIIDENGKPIDQPGITDAERYLQEMSYIKKRLKEVVEEILKSPRPSVIVIASDHGTQHKKLTGYGASSEMRKKWDSTLELSEVRADLTKSTDSSLFANFIAIRFHDGKKIDLPGFVTNINILRTVFNVTFGDSWKMKEDRFYVVSGGLANLKTWEFMDQTEQVRTYLTSYFQFQESKSGVKIVFPNKIPDDKVPPRSVEKPEKPQESQP